MDTNVKLEIIIPTYNHPDYIQYILKNYMPLIVKYDFMISIHDSSTNDETEEIVQRYKIITNKINYYRYDPNIDVDEKTMLSIRHGLGNFVLLCGDGWVINVESIFKSKYFDLKYDMILVYDKNVKVFSNYYKSNIKNEEYYPCINSEYLRKHFWHSTLYGASILNKRLYDVIDYDYIIENYNHTNFIYPVAITDALFKLKGSIYVASDNFLIRNERKDYRKVAEQTDIIKIWCRNYTLAIEKLSTIIGAGNADYIIKTTGRRTGLLTASSLAGRRVLKQFNWEIYRQYKSYILKTMACSKFTLYLLLCMPRWALSLFKWTRRGIKRIFRIKLDYQR